VAIVAVKDLIEAGVHFGHRASRWNPKMRPYIYGKRNLIHIIDLRETMRGLLRACKYLNQIASQGKTILFVGTKRQAKETIEKEAARCGMPYVSERWLGGTLTNFRTIRSRLQRLQELEQMEATGQIHTFSKKMISSLSRERKKIFRNLQGIREMTRPPEAIVVVDPHREHIAVKEARKVGVTTVALIDTDSDPDTIDLAIPGNDDSIRSIELIVARFAQAIIDGRASLPKEALAPKPELPPPSSEQRDKRPRRGGKPHGLGGRGPGGGGGGGQRREPSAPPPPAPASAPEAPPPAVAGGT
jgi:small subunit ribosomal protein S2